ncbi:Uncharacterised protein [Vibrio cholerae]|nr:Uncharacterised protein [Vibrio cholerae]
MIGGDARFIQQSCGLMKWPANDFYRVAIKHGLPLFLAQ